MDDSTPIVEAPRKPPPRFRRTRIAVSVFFAVLTVLLCVLWVRSYWWTDIFRDRYMEGGSSSGHLTVCMGDMTHATTCTLEVYFNASGLDSWQQHFPTHFSVTRNCIIAPHWAFACAFAIFAISPWSPFIGTPLSSRFSLRTMLIATTLVAVVLGLAVWAGR